MVRGIGAILPSSIGVWAVGLIAALAFSGIVMAGVGAYAPARNAGRLSVATVLHNE
jgi:putative ABC transport system permease protein